MIESTVLTDQQRMFARLRLGTLPAEGQAMVAAGQQASLVSALFPQSAAEVKNALVAWLAHEVNLKPGSNGDQFVSRVEWLSSRCNISRWLLAGLFALSLPRTTYYAKTVVLPTIGLSDISPDIVDAGLLVAQVAEILSWWVIADGSEVFTSEQALILDDIVRFWFALLRFGRRS